MVWEGSRVSVDTLNSQRKTKSVNIVQDEFQQRALSDPLSEDCTTLEQSRVQSPERDQKIQFAQEKKKLGDLINLLLPKFCSSPRIQNKH